MRRLSQDRIYEHALAARGMGPVAGVDEAGRGACAGPLVVAACILPPEHIDALNGLTDSKKLSAARRERLEPVIKDVATAWSVISISAADIDAHGVGVANLSGMRRAVEALPVRPGFVLTDAWHISGLRAPHLPMVKGDAVARCIAAASVLAKVARDRIMVEHDARWPGYGFATHKGYGTAAHMAAVAENGPADCHRMSYANIAAASAHHPQRRRRGGSDNHGGKVNHER
ncbi:ribonuclease HII [Corynebacterium sp. TAE3-ERU12]|uniref:ribonuclease HII n=1 Tax=Corynebacterium sp. TAE3-ERU12 TaxID=2849491 RepID=UPI0021046C38|nr:ribonuclease HII [Corynebacterium sp. TAE3-ERU12]